MHLSVAAGAFMRVAAVSLAVILALPSTAAAWGSKGHQIIAAIAQGELTPDVRAKVEALLAGDTDSLTAHDIEAEATWADAYRGAGHKETASWHFVDLELDHADLQSACFGFPHLNGVASAGPADDCVVDKIEEFTRELQAPSTAPAERLLALKYVLHFVGDLHQPLHAADNHDRGGNCVPLSLGGPRTTNLHAFWDTGVLEPLGGDPVAIATKLRAEITADRRAAWVQGTPRSWAIESYAAARTVTYSLNSAPGCDRDRAPISLPDGYADRALATAKVQLERAGIRLAAVLNQALT